MRTVIASLSILPIALLACGEDYNDQQPGRDPNSDASTTQPEDPSDMGPGGHTQKPTTPKSTDCASSCDDPANATGSCADGVCTLACNEGFADCDADPSNGCEVDLTSDEANCGSCDSVCPSTNGKATCNEGTCQITCKPGFSDCDGKLANGCEMDVNSDVKNCGACNRACSTSCVGAICGPTTEHHDKSLKAYEVMRQGLFALSAEGLRKVTENKQSLLPGVTGSTMAVDESDVYYTTDYGGVCSADAQFFMHPVMPFQKCTIDIDGTILGSRNGVAYSASIRGANGSYFGHWEIAGYNFKTTDKVPLPSYGSIFVTGAFSAFIGTMGNAVIAGSDLLWTPRGTTTNRELLVDLNLPSGQFSNVVFADDTTAFIAEASEGRIRSVPLAGGKPKVLASGQKGAANIYGDDKYIYWTTSDNTIVRLAKSGKDKPLVIVRAFEPVSRLRTLAGRVYWMNNNSKTIQSVSR